MSYRNTINQYLPCIECRGYTEKPIEPKRFRETTSLLQIIITVLDKSEVYFHLFCQLKLKKNLNYFGIAEGDD